MRNVSIGQQVSCCSWNTTVITDTSCKTAIFWEYLKYANLTSIFCRQVCSFYSSIHVQKAVGLHNFTRKAQFLKKTKQPCGLNGQHTAVRRTRCQNVAWGSSQICMKLRKLLRPHWYLENTLSQCGICPTVFCHNTPSVTQNMNKKLAHTQKIIHRSQFFLTGHLMFILSLSLHFHLSTVCLLVPSVLWRCWLGGRKGIRPVKNWVVGCWRGYLSGARCRLAYGPADATATHCLLLQ